MTENNELGEGECEKRRERSPGHVAGTRPWIEEAIGGEMETLVCGRGGVW